MYLIDTSRNGKPIYNARINQSLDNYFVNDLKLPGRGFMIYINEPSVIIGKNQNAWAEVDLDYINEHHIDVVRRTSGGGAVYHDMGNLVFENIVVDDDSHFGDYGYFAKPILDALQKLGVAAKMKANSSDLIVKDKKFSGMTMFKSGNSLAAGGTIMYDLNIQDAKKGLWENQDEKRKKLGVASKRSEIVNLKSLLPANTTIEDLKNYLIKEVFGVADLGQIRVYHLTAKDWQIIDQRLDEKYGTDEWNFGKNPGYYHYDSLSLPNGKLGINFTIEAGKILRFKFNPFFKVEGNLGLIERSLIGTKVDQRKIAKVVASGELVNIDSAVLSEAIFRSIQSQ